MEIIKDEYSTTRCWNCNSAKFFLIFNCQTNEAYTVCCNCGATGNVKQIKALQESEEKQKGIV